MSDIRKPLLVARQEFADKLTALINETSLPLVVIQPLVENLAKSIQSAVRQQYEAEKQEYQTAVNEAKEKGE